MGCPRLDISEERWEIFLHRPSPISEMQMLRVSGVGYHSKINQV